MGRVKPATQKRRRGFAARKGRKSTARSGAEFPFALELLRKAREARKLASAPYSRFRVGAALLTATGDVITGANVESVSYGLTCCAERIALFKALTEGYSNFIGLAVVARVSGGPMPCGACRQLLAEYAPQATIVVADSGTFRRFRTFAVQELLPGAFLKGPLSPRPPLLR